MMLFGYLKNGTLTWKNPKAAKECLRAYSDGRVQVHIIPYPTNTTERLRRFYWALCRLIAQFLEDNGHHGMTAETIHEQNKAQYFTDKEMDVRTGEVVSSVRSTMDISSAELLEVIHNLQVVWAQRGLYLPDPNEGHRNDL